MSRTKRCPKNKDNSKSRYITATILKQLVVNIIYFFIPLKKIKKNKNHVSGCDATCAQSNSILKTSLQKYRGYVLVPFFVTNYISRIFATSMKPR